MPGTAEQPVGSGNDPELSIVLATLNERRNLPELLARLRAARPGPYELIVVDDGSSDGTRELLTEEARTDPALRLVFHDGKQTTLQAHCQGIGHARGRYVVVMDADLQHPPELLPAIRRELEQGAALVVASRYAHGGSPGERTVARAVISRGAEAIAKLMLPPARGVSDPVSGFFAFRSELWTPLNPFYRGYKLLLFVLVMTEGRRRAEVGFRFVPRTEGASKVTAGADFLRLFLIEVVLAARLRRAGRRLPPSTPEAAPRPPSRDSEREQPL